MKCTKCSSEAVINLPQHRLKLCAEHLPGWVTDMAQRAIERYGMFTREERVLVAVSGGKDSLSLWQVLIDLGYQTEGLHIHLGIEHEEYSDRSQEKVEAFAASHGNLPFRVVNVRNTYGKTITELTRTRRGQRTCSLCGRVKRHIMNRTAYEGGFGAIATGHNLDDEAATLFGNTLRWDLGYLQRQAPTLPSSHPHLARKVKPFCRIYERESAAYALVRGIDYIDQECPFAVHAKSIAYKGILNQIETLSAGAKLHFYESFLRAKEEGLVALEEQQRDWVLCRTCGQPTTAGDQCAFCRLWEAEA